jgi:hypothetical protein
MKFPARTYFLFIIPLIIYEVLTMVDVCAQQNRRPGDSIYHRDFGREQPIKAILKTSILSPFRWQLPYSGEYRLLGEFMIAPKQSLSIGASYLTRSVFFALGTKIASMSSNSSSGAKVAMNGYRVQGAYKYYFFNKKYRPEGLYLAVHGSFASMKVNYKNYPNEYQLLEHFNLNLLIGGQVIIRNRVSLELFLGPGYKNNIYISRCPSNYLIDFSQFSKQLRSHFKFNLGINIGVVL